jgi:hypothetical protein
MLLPKAQEPPRWTFSCPPQQIMISLMVSL